MPNQLLTFHPFGIYCPQADVYIDPWKPVDRALVTHAHSDHSRWGMKNYLAHQDSVPIMRHRLGEINIEGVPFNKTIQINGVKFSFHPAGHILGSSQIRVEYKGEVWVASGDYKTTPDKTCAAFEPIDCHTFITESTFGLPIFDWQDEEELFDEINNWWAKCKAEGKTACLFGYSLGKAQRLIQNLNPDIGKIYTHGAVEATNQVLRNAGHIVQATIRVTADIPKKDFPGNIVVAPPSAMGTPWMKRFLPYETAIASGWMALRGTRRRRNADRGFVLSDHADWIGLNEAIEATGAEKIYVTHGYQESFSRWIREQGLESASVKTEYEGELSEIGEGEALEIE
jgi:putative mRNA 3-end processing factor